LETIEGGRSEDIMASIPQSTGSIPFSLTSPAVSVAGVMPLSFVVILIKSLLTKYARIMHIDFQEDNMRMISNIGEASLGKFQS
jgi:hypothetical protein